MPLFRVFQFLLKLSSEEYWGAVTISFKKGVIGHVEEKRSFITGDTLPLPDASNLRYQELLAEAAKGVGLPT